MIHLQIQDEFNGTTKQQDLMEVVGKTFSDNYSSTGRSRLVKIFLQTTFVLSRKLLLNINQVTKTLKLVKKPERLGTYGTDSFIKNL